MKNLTWFVLGLLCLLPLGCGGSGENEVASSPDTENDDRVTGAMETGAVTAYLGTEGELIGIALPNGIWINDGEEISTAIAKWLEGQSDVNDSLEIRFAEDPSATAEMSASDTNEEPGMSRLPLYAQIPGTDIGVRISTERHFIGACINRYDCWHAHLAFNYYRGSRQGQQIVNYHLALWYDGSGRPCGALYESVSGSCWGPYCGPSYQNMVGTLAGALAVYVSWNVANTVANVVVPIVIGIATVVPGVPPPP